MHHCAPPCCRERTHVQRVHLTKRILERTDAVLDHLGGILLHRHTCTALPGSSADYAHTAHLPRTYVQHAHLFKRILETTDATIGHQE